MTDVVSPLPMRRPELSVSQLGDKGRHVVKDPVSGDYFHLGEVELFLLEQLNGRQSPADISKAFELKFDDSLTMEELNDFVKLAGSRGFLQTAVSADGVDDWSERTAEPTPEPARQNEQPKVTTQSLPRRQRQSMLYWRRSVFDPDRLFNWLQPKIRVLWTRTFFVLSVLSILAATLIVWSSSQQLVTQFSNALRWETVAIAWLTLIAVTTCHEFAHGLTCKRYGGEVHEIGFLLMFFMPCFYCNVSDAWLFREKSKRLWVTLAGAWCDLCVWAIAVFVWRLTYPDSLLNYLSWVVMSVAGVRVLFNFNPLIKLDGYYLLSDATEIPNMHQRGVDYAQQHLRWLLWGASRPTPQPRGRILLCYGLTCWLFSLVLITMMLTGLGQYLNAHVGPAGFAVPIVLGGVVGRGLLAGLSAGEITAMVWRRHVRTLVWVAVLGSVTAALFLVPLTDRATGVFEVRPVTHREIRAPISAFLRQVYYGEGEEVSAGHPIAQLSIPDLASRIAQKQAELRESELMVKLLRIGARPEEIVQQRRRVEQSHAWRDIAMKDLERQRQTLIKELIRFDKQLAEYQAECDYAEQVVAKLERLRRMNAVSEDALLEERKKHVVYKAQYERTVAEKAARASAGTRFAESELAERDKELVVEQSQLALLEVGSRTEEIEAAEAGIARLTVEIKHLRETEQSLMLDSPVDGAVMTPRLREKIGTWFQEGELILEIEDPRTLEVLITLDEEQAANVRPGQTVRLKARALPFEIFEAQVTRIAPRAVSGDLQSTVTVYCRMKTTNGELRSGMTGYARVERGESPSGTILAKRFLRLIRTEFWW